MPPRYIGQTVNILHRRGGAIGHAPLGKEPRDVVGQRLGTAPAIKAGEPAGGGIYLSFRIIHTRHNEGGHFEMT